MRHEKARLNTPTILTLIRIILIMPLMICIFIDALPAQIVAILCFVVASVTDFVDGRLARKNNQVTNLGKFLDPLADKMLVNLTFLALVVLEQVPVWMFGVILIRDFMIDGLRMMTSSKGIALAAGKIGKIKTTVQMVTITSILVNLIFVNEVWGIINIILLYVVVFLTVWSGADYLYKGRKLMI